MTLENELKKVNHISLKGDFKANLKKRLMNEYEMVLLERAGIVEDVILPNSPTKNLLDRLATMMKFQSAMNLSVVFMFFFSMTALASYVVLPQSIKDSVFGIWNGKYQINISANEKDANVFINGNLVGKTPMKYELSEGNYTVRIEKEGFVIFSQSLSVGSKEQNTIVAELVKDNLSGTVYAGWIPYKNKDLNFSFLYPTDWNIREVPGETPNTNYRITLSKDGSYIDFVVNFTEEWALDRGENIDSFKRIVAFNNANYDRFLQFKDGNFLKGGIIVEAKDNQPKVLIKYSLQGIQENVLNSQILATMDKTVQTLTIGKLDVVVAANPTDSSVVPNEKVDVSLPDPTPTIKPVPTVVAVNKPVVKLDKSYSNSVYGYSISYPSTWSTSTTRADYPLKDRSEKVMANGTEYKVARVKLSSDNGLDLYLFFTNKDYPLFESQDNYCASYSKAQVAYEWGSSKIVKGSGGDFAYQICQNNNGIFGYSSIMNGNVKYAMFVDSDVKENIDWTELSAVVSSFKFDDSLVKYKISDITYPYTSRDLGVNLTYPYYFTLVDQTVDCSNSDRCRKVDIKSGDKILVSISNASQSVDVSDGTTKVIKLASGNVTFKEYTGSMGKYGSFIASNGTEIRYYGDAENSDIVKVLRSIKIN